MVVSADVLKIRGEARKWWGSLSMVQQNEFAKKHLPGISMSDICHYPWYISRIWESEGSPLPEAIKV